MSSAKHPRVDADFRKSIPPLLPEERQGLEESIAREGCRDALVVWKEKDVLLDGHNRLEICKSLGKPYRTKELSFADREAAADWIDSNQLARRNLTPDQASLLRGRRYNRAKKAQGGTGANQHKQKDQIDPSARTAERLGKQHGVSAPTIKRDGAFASAVDKVKAKTPEIEASLIAGKGPARAAVVKAAKLLESNPEKAREVLEGKKTVVEVKREEKAQRQESEREANRSKVEAAEDPATLTGIFSTIIIDPPWDFTEEGDDDVYGRTKPRYAQMAEVDLAKLPVGDRAAKDAHLYLWITNRSLMTGKGWRLCEAWGFRPVTLLTWCKPSIGVGNYFRNSTEHIIFGVKGSLALKNKSTGTWFEWGDGKREHSEKPLESYSLIEACSPGPYLEMFARSKRDGWTSWGAEV